MTLQDVFDYLAHGELQALRLSNSGIAISPDVYEKTIQHINLGLTDLYKRFWLGSKHLILQLYSHIYYYSLEYKYANSNVTSGEVYKYILDSSDDPFLEDVLEIEQVYDQEGTQVPLNDITQDTSVFTSSYKTIYTPPVFKANFEGSILIVQYRMAHSLIAHTRDMDPSEVDVNIPPALLEPLLVYVAYRAQASIGGMEAQQEAMLYQQRYETLCAEAIKSGVGITTNYTNIKLDNNGWV